MKYPCPIKITGIGRYQPARIIKNSTIEKECGLKAGWCKKNIGITTRRWVEDETQSLMGAIAAREAMEDAGINSFDIDLIINASMSFEQKVPDGGPLVQKELGFGDSGIPSLTIQSGCQSFISALDVCVHLLSTERYNTILIVSSEIMSAMLDPRNIGAYAVFGDGAGAVVVSRAGKGESSSVLNSVQESYSDYLTMIISKYGLTAFQEKLTKPEDIALQINWELFKQKSIEYTEKIIKKVIKDFNVSDINVAILQQPALSPGIFFEEQKVYNTMSTQGLCGAASYPMALYENVKQGKLKRNDIFLFAGTGDGIIASGMLLRY
ncbi:MAG: hypothetical protein JXB88_04000 [Spirochaetales bacterium]|nr:hypothetical protein [Spirochaetales bacterium]